MTNSLSTIPINRLNSNELNEKINTSVEEKADIDLSNLSTAGQEILDNKLNKQMISNCITEIPQDIKLDLRSKYAWYNNGLGIYLYTDNTSVFVNDKVYGYTNIHVVVGTVTNVSGTTITVYFPEEYDAVPTGAELDFTRDSSGDVTGILTLKAGSKVYVPNGFEEDGTTPKFDIVTIASDLTYTNTSNTTYMVFYTLSTNKLNGASLNSTYSGTVVPATGELVFYDSDDNTLGFYINGVLQTARSLPLAIITANSTQITSIDQIFNGFGYIGSTVFVLPGVRGLIPNGRNADGSLRNIEVVNDSVKTTTTNYTISNGLVALNKIGVHEISTALWNYNEEKNIFENSLGQISQHFVVASASYNEGVISNFKPKTTFRALDYNDKSTIVGWGMPDYSAGVSKSGTWTAEYAGIYSIRFGNVTNQEGAFLVNGQQFYGRCRNLEEVQTIWAPIPKGATVTLQVANISSIFYPFMEE